MVKHNCVIFIVKDYSIIVNEVHVFQTAIIILNNEIFSLTFQLLSFLSSFSLDDEESGDDEDVLSRQAIKMRAQQIIDSKNKKHKPRKNERKTK